MTHPTSTAAGSPKSLAVQTDMIPAVLKAMDRFVVWRYVETVDPETGEVDYDKPPVNARTNGPASSTNPKSWTAFAEARTAYECGGLDGIGFVLHRAKDKDGKEERGGLVGVDLDDCRDRETGEITPWALEVVHELDTYTEASPSGEGVRLFLYADLPPHGRKRGDYENYQSGRYVTVTGQHIEGTPLTIEHRQEQLLRVHLRVFGDGKPKTQGPARDWTPPTLDDAELIRRASSARSSGEKFARLWRGEVVGHNSASEADLALCNYLAFWCGPNEGRIADLFAQSGLFRSKWNREDYRKRTIGKALAGRTEFYNPQRNGHKQSVGVSGKGAGDGQAGMNGKADGEAADRQSADGGAKSQDASAWTQPIPFDAGYDLPPSPTHLLPVTLRQWVEAESEATQTPPDLAASLALSICGAALAGKVRVVVRDGWTEPTNIFTAAALPPGDRKSAVVTDALAPVLLFEQEEQERMAPIIAEAASEHRMLEAKLKIAEQQAAKAADPEECRELRHDAKQLAKELAAHIVPEQPQLFCDDETPENLTRIVAKQGGRMLQASAEGTAFEIVKGRYSESPNFDVYLKGHAGDPLRVGRVGRERDTVDRPALSVALAVQPDVIQGLAEQAILRGRGFLARFLYSLPISWVGSRTIGPRPVPKTTEAVYRETVLRLWRLQGAVEDGKPAAHLVRFAAAADRLMQDFERWLEPQMAEGEELSLLAGWAQKLAGAAARIAGVLHVTEAVAEGRPWNIPIGEQTVEAAVSLARDYFLPHAQAAFAVMGADAKADHARHAWASIANRCAHAAHSANGGASVTRRDIHNWNRRRFPNVEELDPILAVLCDRYYLRPSDGTGRPGRGHSSPVYQVNPLALAAFINAPPRSHCAQRAHLTDSAPPSAHAAHSADAPPRLETQEMDVGQAGTFTAPDYDPDHNPFQEKEEI